MWKNLILKTICIYPIMIQRLGWVIHFQGISPPPPPYPKGISNQHHYIMHIRDRSKVTPVKERGGVLWRNLSALWKANFFTLLMSVSSLWQYRLLSGKTLPPHRPTPYIEDKHGTVSLNGEKDSSLSLRLCSQWWPTLIACGLLVHRQPVIPGSSPCVDQTASP